MNGRRPAEAVPPRDLVAIDPKECRALLRTRGVGRVVFVDARGPVALPVNYVVDRDDIVFRTAESSSVLASEYASRVGFEVDALDESDHQGWSVLVTGRVQKVDDAAELRHVQMLPVTPWAAGPRPAYLRLHVDLITGRRLVPAAPHEAPSA